MNNWQILGIEPTKDKREIKSAYAKKLAEYHPEEHPEQFWHIKEAYDSALLYAECDPAPAAFEPEEPEEEMPADKNPVHVALAELSQIFNYPPGIMFQDVYTTLGLRKFVAGELFESVKDDPDFIDGMTELFTNHPLSLEDISLLREIFELKPNEIDYRKYSSELIPILDRIESRQKDKADREKKRTTRVRGSLLLLWFIVIFIVWYFWDFFP